MARLGVRRFDELVGRINGDYAEPDWAQDGLLASVEGSGDDGVIGLPLGVVAHLVAELSD